MKLKKLTIHNIASIEDAVIDFAGSELAGQDLFLICGPTGAGKSTILDAICLALFNNTPRIKNSTNDSIDLLADEDTRKKEKVKDVLHLVRKNAPEAYVSLSFEGIDNKECTALWSVKRKIRKSKNDTDQKKYDGETLEEKLRRGISKEWTLTDGDGVTFEKTTEVEARIQDLIKMNFDQFCKTTMLAQGDFTKFLSSSSDEKAQILEKLVGTEKYAEVGAVINATSNAKKNEIDQLNRELQHIIFLTEEQKTEYQAYIEGLRKEAQAMGEQGKVVDAKLKWIDDHAKATQNVAQAKLEMEHAEAELNKDEVKAESGVVDLWRKSINVRAAIERQKQGEQDFQNQAAEQKRLSEVYVNALGGLKDLKACVEQLTAENESLFKKIEAQQSFEAMFSQVDVICSDYNNLLKNNQFVALNEPKLKAYGESIDKWSKTIEELGVQKKAYEEDIKKVENEQRELEHELEKHGVRTIDEEVRKLNDRITAVVDASHALNTWHDATRDYTVRSQAYKDAVERSKQLEAAVQVKHTELQRVTADFEKSRDVYEKTRSSVEDHAKLLRAELKVGDTCPVCGKRVDAVLSDETFVAMLKPLEAKYREDEALLDKCRKEHAQAEADVKANRKVEDDALKAADVVKARKEQAWKSLGDCCLVLKIACEEQHIAQSLEALKVQYEKEQLAISQRQKAIKDIREKNDELTRKLGQLRNDLYRPLVEQLDEANKEVNALKEKQQKLSGQIQTTMKNTEELKLHIRSLLNPDWKPTDKHHYIKELKEAAEFYKTIKDTYTKNSQTLADWRKDLGLVDTSRHDILAKFADWHELEPHQVQHVDGLVQYWTKLQNRVYELAIKMVHTQEQLKQAQEVIAAFFGEHAEVSMESVQAIMAYGEADIERMNKHLQGLKDAMTTAKAKLEAAEKRQAELPENPLGEGETEDTLKEQTEKLKVGQQEKMQEIGRIQNELEADQKNREAQGQKKVELDNLKAEYAEWKTLDQYLGSSDGKNFRNVAQSFILSDLLDKANAYLETITGRYTLFCNPGTLTIMMRDAYQGGVIRPTNTLSGGESFIISLSLALGLSSMQSVGFEVDTLFIDEGFGTLSPEFLDPVISSLKRLYEKYNRRVGIISHVETLKARIPVTIEVTREGNSSSKVEVVCN